MFGAPSSYFPSVYPNYSLAYNPKTRNPDWVYEHLDPKSIRGNVKRTSFSFKQDTQIPITLQAALSDFYSKRFDRGHFAAAANYRSSKADMERTFRVSNISPFNQSLNRGYWGKLEKYVRNLTEKYGPVDVVSGPLFLPKIIELNGKRYKMQEVIGENNVFVPTHFYKVLTLENEFGELETEAYIIPNEPISKTCPLATFRTTVEKVEKAAGIIFHFKA